MELKNIYLISGLGADERIFHNLVFPAGYKVHYLPWIQPLGPFEPIASYAARMIEKIDTPGEVYLVGVSFGGMMCIEIAKLIRVEKIILISSIKNKDEKPYFYNKFTQYLFNHFSDNFVFKNRAFFVRLFLQSHSAEEKALVRDYLNKKDYSYLRWAVGAVLDWDNTWIPAAPMIHIHGSKDRPFPVRSSNPTHIIEGGGHFMVLNRAKEISELISKFLFS
ncbi:alpha/beta hydrolase [Chitinophaga caeni]|uniref:Alpha/beta hydrolase n=1 Tax=Chitinophaga caeni TaxID=2029983 RepID=A0A291QVH6_9BACT|nr:alpha/beta hydrolase [Chitinophaga caeni]